MRIALGTLTVGSPPPSGLQGGARGGLNLRGGLSGPPGCSPEQRAPLLLHKRATILCLGGKFAHALRGEGRCGTRWAV